MSSLVEKRNRIREAVPHLASASGSIASFQTDMRSPLEEIKIHFNPVQSGTGTPSPTNVRPLSGWSGCNLYISPTQDASLGNQIPVSWSEAGTIYGGWADPIKGIGEAKYGAFVIDGVNFSVSNGLYDTNRNRFGGQINLESQIKIFTSTTSGLLCDIMPMGYNISSPTSPYVQVVLNQRRFVVVCDSLTNHPEITDADEAKNYTNLWLQQNTPTIVAELLNPMPFTFTTISPVKSLVGQNNIWSNANGDVDVRYWKH